MIKTSKKSTLDFTALAIFFPAVVALAIIPTLIRATMVASDSFQMRQLYDGTPSTDPNVYYYLDKYSQVKALAVVIVAVFMLVIALACCLYLFRKAEKRSLVYVGASVVYVVMTLASAMGSQYGDIAFYGLYSHAEGFFTIAAYFVLFLFTMYAFKKTQNFSFVVLALMICTTVNLIIGLFQYFGNDLFNFEWFRNLVIDPEFKDILNVNETITTQQKKMFGALYHYNYMGSFTGMIVPLFTVLAFTSKKLVYKIVTAFFALISVFMMLAGEARSGFVAVAAAAVVGIIVFARVLIRRWKITVSVLGAALVAVVGLNIVTDNAVFARVPSLLEDIAGLVAPAEQTDLFASLPVREITHNEDGSVSFTSQTDVLTMSFDSESSEYIFTDSAGEAVPTAEIAGIEGGIYIADEDFPGLNFQLIVPDEETGSVGGAFLWFYNKDDSALAFRLYKNNQLHLIDIQTERRVEPINAEAIGFEGREKLGSSRGYIWSRTIPLLRECLITGYGPDTFAFVFPQNDYLAKYYAYDEGFYMIIDKPHNLYLQIFMGSGLIALIAFLAICIFYLVDCVSLYALKKTYRSEQCFGISVMLAIVGYLAAGLFNDSVVSVAPVFWILLGTGAALNTINRRMDKQERENAAAHETVAEQETVVDTKPKNVLEMEGVHPSFFGNSAPEQITEQRAEPLPERKAPTEADTIAMMEKLLAKSREEQGTSGTQSQPSPDGAPGDEEILAMMKAVMEKREQIERRNRRSASKPEDK